jgi:hypothetical protein
VVIAIDNTTNGGPLALRNISQNEDFDVWAGGMIAEGNGKIVDTTESVFRIPPAMLTTASQKIYEAGVKYAEAAESRLRWAVSIYHNELGDKLERPEMKTRREQIQRYAALQFWTNIEQAVRYLLDVVAVPADLGLHREWHRTKWGDSVHRTSHSAYDRACPRATARQMRAYALGLRAFAPPTEPSRAEKEKKS